MKTQIKNAKNPSKVKVLVYPEMVWEPEVVEIAPSVDGVAKIVGANVELHRLADFIGNGISRRVWLAMDDVGLYTGRLPTIFVGDRAWLVGTVVVFASTGSTMDSLTDDEIGKVKMLAPPVNPDTVKARKLARKAG